MLFLLSHMHTTHADTQAIIHQFSHMFTLAEACKVPPAILEQYTFTHTLPVILVSVSCPSTLFGYMWDQTTNFLNSGRPLFLQSLKQLKLKVQKPRFDIIYEFLDIKVSIRQLFSLPGQQNRCIHVKYQLRFGK